MVFLVVEAVNVSVSPSPRSVEKTETAIRCGDEGERFGIKERNFFTVFRVGEGDPFDC